MRLKYFKLLFLFLFIMYSNVAYAVDDNTTTVEFKKIAINSYSISIKLFSGIKISGIRYKKIPLLNKWGLILQHNYGLNVKNRQSEKHRLTKKEFEELIFVLISYLSDKQKPLNTIHLDLSLVDELWENTARHLRENIPLSYKLKAKDLQIAKIIGLYLRSKKTIKNVCELSRLLDKKCLEKSIGMNPITFEVQYINSNWQKVKDLKNLGIDLNKHWYGISLVPIK